MRKFSFGVVFAVLSAASPSWAAEPAAAQADPTCSVAQLTTVRTDFPQASQTRGEYGNVVLKVSIDKDGRASKPTVTQSSGFSTLDKAAAESVAKHWRFDVAHCATNELPTDSFVTVQFQRAARYTLSGTVNTQRNTESKTQSRCDTALSSNGDQIVACLSNPPTAGKSNPSSLASTDLIPHK